MRLDICSGCRISLMCAVFVLWESGCSTFRGAAVYRYRAINENCNCAEYSVRDGVHKIDYLFRATYTMDRGILTRVEIVLTNRSDDTLYLDRGTAKVSSRNITYQYNDKFLPLPDLRIPPGGRDIVLLTGTDTDIKADWHKIAGEEMTVTIKGLLVGDREVTPQTVIFVPVNPKLQE